MVPLSRRELLRGSVAAVALAASGGCLSADEPAPTDPPAETATAVSPSPETATPTDGRTATETTPTDPIQVDLYNDTDAERTVRYRITSENETLAADEVTIPAAEFASVPSNVGETGTYEFTVSVEGIGEETTAFTVGDYAVRTGSNFVAWVYEDRLELAMEQ